MTPFGGWDGDIPFRTRVYRYTKKGGGVKEEEEEKKKTKEAVVAEGGEWYAK